MEEECDHKDAGFTVGGGSLVYGGEMREMVKIPRWLGVAEGVVARYSLLIERFFPCVLIEDRLIREEWHRLVSRIDKRWGVIVGMGE